MSLLIIIIGLLKEGINCIPYDILYKSNNILVAVHWIIKIVFDVNDNIITSFIIVSYFAFSTLEALFQSLESFLNINRTETEYLLCELEDF